ncbi:MAG: hypothetical protein JW774_13190 [Candidatus Aureabacteria bacterium]|nr:hypothetical protein [Candidatus Auribacterota bacterium]
MTPMPPEQDAVTIVQEKVDEILLQHFLKQIAVTAYGGIQRQILTDAGQFKTFFNNFKYNPERYVQELHFKARAPNINKYILVVLNALQPEYTHSILTEQSEYFLYCNTIRGPQILAISLRPMTDTLYSETYERWNLSILSIPSFSKNLLLNEDHYKQVIRYSKFIDLLTNKHNRIRSPYFPAVHLFNHIFFETLPDSGYDVSSVTRENQYFDFKKESQRQLCFLSLPIVQYSLSNNKALDFFFMIKDPDILSRIQALLSHPSFSSSIAASTINDQISVYLTCLSKNEFEQKIFEQKLQNIFEHLNYSINYDAIVTTKRDEVYCNLNTFLLSNGISTFKDIENNRKTIEKIIGNFFVLGTTYFYRSWKSLSVFQEYLADIKTQAGKENRPVKFKIFACSTGEEVLTFALSLLDNGISDFTILGTDINSKFIETAKKMVYPRECFERLPEKLRKHILTDYFIKTSDGYAIKDKDFFSKRIFYQVADITKPLPQDLPQEIAPPYDLISCQNIFLYLNPKIIPSLYHDITQLLSENGLFILSDKTYDHFSLKQYQSKSKPILHINKYLVKACPNNFSLHDLKENLEKINKDATTYPSIKQYYEISGSNYQERNKWLESLLKKPGNHELIYLLQCHNLLEHGYFKKARECALNNIFHSPYLYQNYKLLHEAECQLKQNKNEKYIFSIMKGVEIFYSTKSTDSIRKALNLFQDAIKLNPDNPLAFYVLAYQFIYFANNLKKGNTLLIEYEPYLNQAYKNFSYILSKQPENIYAYRGIAEIAYTLYESYAQTPNNEIAARLIYNALYKFEPAVKQSSDFTILYPLAKLQLKMAALYLSTYKLPENARKYIRNSLANFKKAEENSSNFTDALLYQFYTHYSEAWFTLYKIIQSLPRQATIVDSPNSDKYLYNAMKFVDTALDYNSVYGIEAVEIRNQIIEKNSSIKKKFLDSF